MIHINLVPGSAKKARSGPSAASLTAALADLGARIKDPFLIAAVASVAITSAAVGGLFVTQSRYEAELVERERVAVQDSTRYAAVIGERDRVQTQLDAVVRQLAIIRTVDNSRYVWPHVMDEISEALPPYTWLTSVTQTSASASIAAADTAAAAGKAPAAGAAKGAGKGAAKAAPPPVPEVPPMKFQIVGHTVDIQALTRYMRVLEASPFIQNVNLVKSTLTAIDNRDVTEFQLDAEYQVPDPSVVRTVPVSFPTR
jgi:Tfp pilus assembly protein PilN